MCQPTLECHVLNDAGYDHLADRSITHVKNMQRTWVPYSVEHAELVSHVEYTMKSYPHFSCVVQRCRVYTCNCADNQSTANTLDVNVPAYTLSCLKYM